MALELRMPALSPTMEKGTLAKWLVKAGDHVKPGDLVAEIETDKATMEFEASEEGVISQILVPGGSEDVAVGTVLALMGAEGETALEPVAANFISAPAKVQAEAAPAGPVPAPAVTQPVSPPRHDPVPPPALVEGINATPLAKRVAAIKGIALGGIVGSGPRARSSRLTLACRRLQRQRLLALRQSPCPIVE